MEQTNGSNIPGEKTAGNGGPNKKKVFAVLAIIVIAFGIWGAQWAVFRLNYTSTDDAQIDADLIPVSSRSAGRIITLRVEEGNSVRRGRALAVIDPADYQLALARARAGLEQARNELAKAETNLALTADRSAISIAQSESSVIQADKSVRISTTQQNISTTKIDKDIERAEVNLHRASDHRSEAAAYAAQAKNDMERAKSLYDKGVTPKAQYDLAVTNASIASDRLAQVEREVVDAQKTLDIARNNLRVTQIDSSQVDIARENRQKAALSLELSKKQKMDIKVARNTVLSLRAKVRELEAAVAQAAIALDETAVTSPVNGIVAKKVSQKYEVVAAGKPVFYVLDTDTMWVTANIEETNLDKIKIGSEAKITVDGMPGKVLHGKIRVIGAAANSKFSLIPQGNPTGQFIKITQRIPVKIMLDDHPEGLRPGMNAIVTIKNAH